MLHGSRVKSLPPMEERQVFNNSLINLLQANFHSNHYNHFWFWSKGKQALLSFPTFMQKAYEHFLSGSGGHAADSQSSSSICSNSSICVKDYGFVFLSYEGASKEESLIILKEGLFTLYYLFLLNTIKESKDISPDKLDTLTHLVQCPQVFSFSYISFLCSFSHWSNGK